MERRRSSTERPAKQTVGELRRGRKLATAKHKYKLPKGVTIRSLVTGERLQIAFTYNGVQCRELLPEQNITKAYIDYANGIRLEINRKITDGTFNYEDFFPESPRVEEFSPERKKHLMATLFEKQLSHYGQQALNGTISPSTHLGYKKIIDGRLAPKWGGHFITEITPSELRQWIAGLSVTAKTARNILSPLRSIFDDAVNDEIIDFNPLDRIALSKILRQTSKKSEYEVDPFDINETEALIKHARVDERPFIQFWLATGLRTGEMLALPWRNIDWINKTMRIDTNIVTGIVDGKTAQVEKAPKTAAGIRDVVLSESALQALRNQKPASFLADDRVWINPRTGEPWTTESQIRKTLWAPLCKRAGVRYRNAYQMRHTFASTLLTNGANPFWLASQMGHEDVEMVFRVYGKWIDSNYQKTIAQTDRCEIGVKSV